MAASTGKKLVWLITGARYDRFFQPVFCHILQAPYTFCATYSSGLGRELAVQALARSERVIATTRARSFSKLDALKAKGADILQLDVTSPLESLRETAEKAVAIHGGIDVLVNNAGASLRAFCVASDL